MSRRMSLALGSLLVTGGLAGLVVVGPATAVAGQTGGAEQQETPHAMMDAMHGPGTAERMPPGAAEMMEQCAAMMSAMDGGMMDGGMMDG